MQRDTIWTRRGLGWRDLVITLITHELGDTRSTMWPGVRESGCVVMQASLPFILGAYTSSRSLTVLMILAESCTHGPPPPSGLVCGCVCVWIPIVWNISTQTPTFPAEARALEGRNSTRHIKGSAHRESHSQCSGDRHRKPNKRQPV